MLEVEENFKQSLSAFLGFFADKKYLLKTLLTCTFTPAFLISFDLASYSSELRKKYTQRLLLMCLEGMEEGFSCSPGRVCEGS